MRYSRRLLLYTTFLFLATLAIRLLLIAYRNNNLGGIESNVVYGIQRLLLGQPLYQDPGSGSFAVMQYTPLYYYTVAAIARMARINAPDVQSVFEIARTCALTFNLLTVALCALIIREQGASRRESLIFAFPVLIIFTSHYYTRGDGMHLFFFVATVWALLRYARQPRLSLLLLCSLTTAACIMTKQSGILCAGFCALGLLMHTRRLAPAVIYTLLTFVLTGMFIFLFAGHNLHHFYTNAILGLRNGADLSFLSDMFISRYFTDLIPFYILGATMVWYALRRPSGAVSRILALCIALSWLFAAVTGCKKGSSNNYFTEFLAFVLLALPGFIQLFRAQMITVKVARWRIPVHKLATAALLILISSKTLGLVSVVFIEKGIKNDKEEYLREQQLYTWFQQRQHIRPGEKIFFTERRFLDNIFIDYSILATRDVTNMVYTANPATYDYSSFTQGMNNGLVKYVVTSRTRDNINICSDSLPFVYFQPSKFRYIASVAGYSIYEFIAR